MNLFDSMRSPRFSVFLGIVLAFSCGHLEALPSDAARPLLDRFLSGLSTFNARFEQRVLDETGELLESSHGTVSISRPGKFAWEYQEPYRQSIISDGSTLWLYDPDLEQVTINAIGTSAVGSAAEILGMKTDLDSRYDILELGARAGAVWLKLTPKTADTQYAAVEIGLQSATLSGIRLFDNLGQITELRFSDAQRNPILASSVFTFSPPPNVDIVTGTGATGD
ncbi:MAG: outer membrane lipoprotein chaperone LolA [Gammaproteobacteria bacterium]